MFGAIVGDVIGSPFEQINCRSVDFPLFGVGSRCTDDSILTIATADALLRKADFAQTYRAYVERYPAAGYGSQFVGWANRRRPGESFGNGAAMRVSPVAWAYDNLGDVLDAAAETSITSHAHPEGILGAQSVAGCVFLARMGRTKEQLRRFIIEGCTYELPASLDAIRETHQFDPSCRGTIPVAFQAFYESTTFENAVRLAVSVGGDSDTIASITGAIAHAHYGGIPRQLLEPVLERFLPSGASAVCADFRETFCVYA